MTRAEALTVAAKLCEREACHAAAVGYRPGYAFWRSVAGHVKAAAKKSDPIAAALRPPVKEVA